MSKTREGEIGRGGHGLGHELIDSVLHLGFSFFDVSDARNRFEWHEHEKHQLVYVECGVALVQTRDGFVSLHPGLAAIVPAGVEHETSVSGGCRLGSVFFDCEIGRGLFEAFGYLRLTPLLSEMLRYASRWTIESEESDCSRRFFACLADVLSQQVAGRRILSVPHPKDELVRALIVVALERLDRAGLKELALELRCSERTLRRRVRSDLGMGWREYLRLIRVNKASCLLTRSNVSVAEVAYAVGFESLSAFSSSFRALVGESPSAFRRAAGGVDRESEKEKAPARKSRGFELK